MYGYIYIYTSLLVCCLLYYLSGWARTEDIKQPRGLAVDSLRKILYVIDGNEGRPKLYAVRLYLSADLSNDA